MFLLTDFINPQGNISFVNRLDKIKHNLNIIKPLKENIEKQSANSKKAFTTLTVFGRWIIGYKSNGLNDNGTIMYFIDFRIDISSFGSSNVFSQDTLKNLMELQNSYDTVFENEMDYVELTLAEPFEKVLKENLFACDSDEIVLSKAKSLGVLPMIETLKTGDRVKVVVADEKLKIDNNNITNVYALIHFGGHSQERKHDNGYFYIKIYGLLNNYDKIKDFEAAIEKAGGKFDRAFFMERFDKNKLN